MIAMLKRRQRCVLLGAKLMMLVLGASVLQVRTPLMTTAASPPSSAPTTSTFSRRLLQLMWLAIIARTSFGRLTRWTGRRHVFLDLEFLVFDDFFVGVGLGLRHRLRR